MLKRLLVVSFLIVLVGAGGLTASDPGPSLTTWDDVPIIVFGDQVIPGRVTSATASGVPVICAARKSRTGYILNCIFIVSGQDGVSRIHKVAVLPDEPV